MKTKITIAILALSTFIASAQSGNVGIGTSSPQSKLHVEGNLRVDSLKSIDYSKYNVVLDTVTKEFAIQKVRPENEKLVRIAARTNSNSIPNSTSTLVVWSSTEINTVPSAWNAATGTFTAPRDGIYKFAAHITYATNTAIGKQVNISAFVNSTTEYATSINFNSNGTGTTPKPTGALNVMVELAQGDIVQFRTFHSIGSTTLLTADNRLNYMYIEELP